MDAGKYTEPVTIEKLAEVTEDADGFESETWENYYSNYAQVNGLFGSERWAAAQVQMDTSLRFTFRWNRKLDSVKPKRYRLIFRGDIYTITHVDNVKYGNETVRIDAVEVEA